MIHAVLTGEVHVGKTTVCRAVVHLARQRGYCVRGILTTADPRRTGQRLGFTCSTWPAANSASWRGVDSADPSRAGPSVGTIPL